MDRNGLAVLAKQVVFHVNEVIAPFVTRLAELEARPVEKGERGPQGAPGEPGAIGEQGPPGPAGTKGEDGAAGTVPIELALQLKGALALLDEPMPSARAVAPTPVITLEDVRRELEGLRRATGSMINRNFELVQLYSDGSSETLGQVIGPAGPQGPQGPQGPAGRDGVDGGAGDKGDEGPPGRDGVGIASSAINRKGELLLTLSDGTVHNPGRVIADEKKRA